MVRNNDEDIREVITQLATADRVYVSLITEFAGPNNLPFTCKEMFISFIPLMFYGEAISSDMATLIIHFGNEQQQTRLFCSLNATIIKKLLRMPEITPEYRSSRALRLAVKADRIDIVKMLLKDGRVDVDAKDGEALILAIRNNNRTMINLLFKNGATVNDERPIIEAIKAKSVKVVKVLLDITKKMQSIIITAIITGNVPIINLILSHKKHGKLRPSTKVIEELFRGSSPEVMTLVLPNVVSAINNVTSYFWRKYRCHHPDVLIAANNILVDKCIPWPEYAMQYVINRCSSNAAYLPIFETLELESTVDLELICTYATEEIIDVLIINNVSLWYLPKKYADFVEVTLPTSARTLYHTGGAARFLVFLEHIIKNKKDWADDEKISDAFSEWLNNKSMPTMMSSTNNDADVENVCRMTYEYLWPNCVDYIIARSITRDYRRTLNYLVLDEKAWTFGNNSMNALKDKWAEDKSLSVLSLIKHASMHVPRVPQWIKEALMIFGSSLSMIGM